MRALDRLLPVYDQHEIHEVEVDANPEAAVAAFLALPSSPGAVTRLLMRARGLGARRTVQELLVGIGFTVLHREPTEIVLGAAGRPWTRRGGIRPFDEAGAGEVRMALDVRATPLPDGRSRLSTETRIMALDPQARRAFARYWRLVAPFSALIRRRWLRAAAANAQAGAGRRL